VWKLTHTGEGSPASCLCFRFLPLRISTLLRFASTIRSFPHSTLHQFPFSPLSPFPYFITSLLPVTLRLPFNPCHASWLQVPLMKYLNTGIRICMGHCLCGFRSPYKILAHRQSSIQIFNPCVQVLHEGDLYLLLSAVGG